MGEDFPVPAGQRDSSYIVPDKGTMGQAQNLATGWARPEFWQLAMEQTRKGQDFDSLSRPGPGRGSEEKKKRKKLQFLKKKIDNFLQFFYNFLTIM